MLSQMYDSERPLLFAIGAGRIVYLKWKTLPQPSTMSPRNINFNGTIAGIFVIPVCSRLSLSFNGSGGLSNISARANPPPLRHAFFKCLTCLMHLLMNLSSLKWALYTVQGRCRQLVDSTVLVVKTLDPSVGASVARNSIVRKSFVVK